MSCKGGFAPPALPLVTGLPWSYAMRVKVSRCTCYYCAAVICCYPVMLHKYVFQSTAIFQAKQKLESINKANEKRISSEDLIKFAHRISASNAVEAPPTWQPGIYLKNNDTLQFP